MRKVNFTVNWEIFSLSDNKKSKRNMQNHYEKVHRKLNLPPIAQSQIHLVHNNSKSTFQSYTTYLSSSAMKDTVRFLDTNKELRKIMFKKENIALTFSYILGKLGELNKK